MRNSVRVVNWVLRRFFQTICKIDRSQVSKIPLQGPYILVGNHVNFLEVPVLVPHLDPRPVIGLAKRESWKNPLFNFLFKQWEVIPIDRGVVDREAFRRMIEVLQEGKMLALSPEGTRSIDGQLLQGKPGVVALGLRSGATFIPMGLHGHVDFWANLKRLRRTDFIIEVGRPFRIAVGEEALSREVRQAVTDEIMYRIAELLPESYWGCYPNADQVRYQYLVDV